jgi:carbamoyl-phosphate synthase small subunit
MTGRLARLALEDGTIFTGRSFGADGECSGEVVFNTSMLGYQEVLTDPSYRGQIVTMTYPLIGNYGTNLTDQESPAVQVRGFLVRELTQQASNFRSQENLHGYLLRNGIVGMEGLDTRALVRRLRVRGAMNGVLSTTDTNGASLVQKARAVPAMLGQDLAREVIPCGESTWTEGFNSPLVTYLPQHEARYHVVALDYGMKQNILRCLVRVGCRVTVLPGTAPAERVLALKPDGVFLSNGPGDPAALGYAIEELRQLIGKTPIFGICLGHQLLGLALGGTTFKLKFGHRGANHPVLNRITNKVEITTQNHGFAVEPRSLPANVEPTHINLNDQTLEGLRHRTEPLFSVQYHPEASAGPHDSGYLFEQFRELMATRKS